VVVATAAAFVSNCRYRDRAGVVVVVVTAAALFPMSCRCRKIQRQGAADSWVVFGCPYNVEVVRLVF
jgi:hypothetical protein